MRVVCPCRINNMFVSHTGKPLHVIEKAMDRDLFMDPETAVEFGIIDSIMKNRSALVQTET